MYIIKHLKLGVGLGLLLALAGCGSDMIPEPIGIGRDLDALKRSPCVCLEVPQDYSDWKKSG